MKTLITIVMAGFCAGAAIAEWTWTGKTGNVTIPAGEVATVTDADIPVVSALTGIEIEETASLTFANTSAMTLPANLSGAGSISASNAGALTLSGDNRLHTGSMVFDNTMVVVSSRYGLGSPTRTVTHNGNQLLFKGEGLVNDVPLTLTGGTGSYDDTKFTEEWTDPLVLNGAVSYSGTRWQFGNYTFAGGLKFSSTIYACQVAANCHAVITNKPLDSSSSVYLPFSLCRENSSLTLAAEGNVYRDFAIHECFSLQQVLICGCVNALYRDTILALGMGASQSAVLDLNGFDQTVVSVCYSPRSGWFYTPVRGGSESVVVRSARPATLTMTGNDDRCVAYAFSGAVSVRKQGTGVYRVVNRYSDTEGTLSVENGSVEFDWDAGWGGDITATGGTVRFLEGAALDLNGGSVVTVEDAGRLYITNGVELICSSLSLGGEVKGVGTYSAATDADWIDGEGSIRVVATYPETPETVNWTGAAGNGLVSDGRNWSTGEAPKLNGSEKLVFTDDGYGNRVTFPTGVRVIYGIEFRGSQGTVLSSLGSLNVGPGGIVSTSESVDVVTNVIESSMCMDFTGPMAANVWDVSGNTALIISGDVSGGMVDNEIDLTGSGVKILSGDNSGLLAKIVQQSEGKLYSRSSTALGSPRRYSTLYSNAARFEGAGLTNETPIIVGDAHRTFPLKENDASTLVMKGDFQFATGVPQVEIDGTWVFEGGMSIQRANPWFQGRGEVFVCGKPLSLLGSTSYFVLSDPVWHIATTNNAFNRIYISNKLVCGATNALTSVGGGTGYVVLGTAGQSGGGTLDLDGYDQDILGSVLHSGTPTEDYPYVGLVKSERPAKLRMTGTVDNGLLPWRFDGPVSFEQAGSGTSTFICWKSPSTGTLAVSAGRAELRAGAGWTNVTDVVITGGTLAVRADSADCAFGPRSGRTKAVLSVTGSGRIEIGEGATVTVREFICEGVDAGTGFFGGPDCRDPRVPASRRIPQIAGEGVLNVRGYGMAITIR